MEKLLSFFRRTPSQANLKKKIDPKDFPTFTPDEEKEIAKTLQIPEEQLAVQSPRSVIISTLNKKQKQAVSKEAKATAKPARPTPASTPAPTSTPGVDATPASPTVSQSMPAISKPTVTIDPTPTPVSLPIPTPKPTPIVNPIPIHLLSTPNALVKPCCNLQSLSSPSSASSSRIANSSASKEERMARNRARRKSAGASFFSGNSSSAASTALEKQRSMILWRKSSSSFAAAIAMSHENPPFSPHNLEMAAPTPGNSREGTPRSTVISPRNGSSSARESTHVVSSPFPSPRRHINPDIITPTPAAAAAAPPTPSIITIDTTKTDSSLPTRTPTPTPASTLSPDAAASTTNEDDDQGTVRIIRSSSNNDIPIQSVFSTSSPSPSSSHTSSEDEDDDDEEGFGTFKVKKKKEHSSKYMEHIKEEEPWEKRLFEIASGIFIPPNVNNNPNHPHAKASSGDGNTELVSPKSAHSEADAFKRFQGKSRPSLLSLFDAPPPKS